MATLMYLAPLLLAASTTGGTSHCSGMSDEQVHSLSRSASTGNSDAAFQLFEHFATSCANNVEDASFWLRLAAEQRSCRGMVEWGRMLRGTGRDVEKGNWWLEEAAEAGCDLPEAGANSSFKRTPLRGASQLRR